MPVTASNDAVRLTALHCRQLPDSPPEPAFARTRATRQIAHDNVALQGIYGDAASSLWAIGRTPASVRGSVTGTAAVSEEQGAGTRKISSGMLRAQRSVAAINQDMQTLSA